MNPIPNIQNVPLIVFAAGVSTPRRISRHVRYGFTFEVTADIAVDAVFKFQAAPADAAKPNAPGAFVDVAEVAICSAVAVGSVAKATIPAGTKAGTIFHGTLPCRPNAFVKLVAESGDTTNVIGTICLSGPVG